MGKDSKKACRGKYFKKYSQNDISNALSEIKSGSSVLKASKKFHIPPQTLRDRIVNKHSDSHGVSKVLSDDQENRLREFILMNASYGSPLTTSEILKLAGEMSTLNSEEAKQFKKGKPSHSWLHGFLKRHGDISARTPESLGRASAIHTPADLQNFFDKVHSDFAKLGHLELLNKPERWWNVDETGFQMNPIPSKVYAKKGARSVHYVERGKPKEMITATYAVCADGNYVEPLLTFKTSKSTIVEIAHAAGCNL